MIVNIELRIEGTLEELAPFFQSLQAIKPKTTASPETNQQEMADEPEYITPEFLRQALKRHPLSVYTKALLRAFVEGEEGVYLSTETLWEKVRTSTGRQKFTREQFNGVFGSLGRRIYQTKGYDGSSHYSEYKEVEGQGHYRLPTELRKVVLEILGI